MVFIRTPIFDASRPAIFELSAGVGGTRATAEVICTYCADLALQQLRFRNAVKRRYP